MPTIITPEGTRLSQMVTDPRGCPGCKTVVAEVAGDKLFVVDTRGRLWCETCVAEVLGEHTRRDEDRAAAHYTWDFPPPKPPITSDQDERSPWPAMRDKP